jgi:hypothetical protein
MWYNLEKACFIYGIFAFIMVGILSLFMSDMDYWIADKWEGFYWLLIKSGAISLAISLSTLLGITQFLTTFLTTWQ